MITLPPHSLNGVIRFVDNVEGEDRLVIPISLAGRKEEIWAIVDTAATFSVIAPNIAQDLGLQSIECDNEKVLMTRWGRVTGNLCRIEVRINTLKIEGTETGIEFEPTFFIPHPDQGWPLDMNLLALRIFYFEYVSRLIRRQTSSILVDRFDLILKVRR